MSIFDRKALSAHARRGEISEVAHLFMVPPTATKVLFSAHSGVTCHTHPHAEGMALPALAG
jgi:hypothetical protein